MDKFEFGKVKSIAGILGEEEAALDMHGPAPKPLNEFMKYLVDRLEKDFEEFVEANNHLDTDRYKNLSPDEIMWAKSIGQ